MLKLQVVEEREPREWIPWRVWGRERRGVNGQTGGI